MNEDFTKRRLQDIEDNIRQDLEMLKGYEDELRFATDHRIIAKCQQDIKRQREFLAKYSKEYLNFTCREANLSKPEEDEKHKSEFIFNKGISSISTYTYAK